MRRALMKVVTGLGTLILSSLGTPAHAQVPEMRFTHFVPLTHPSVIGLKEWADSLQAATSGAMTVKIFPSEQLGKAKDHYNMVRDGIADAGWVVPGYSPGRFPIVSLLELPFAAANADGGSAAFDEWYRTLASSEMPDVHYCFGFLQEPGVLHTRRRVATPSDLKGMKLRTPTAPLGEFFSTIGASSVTMPAPQVREAIERGTIDGTALAWQTAASLGVSKVTTFHLDAPFYTVPVVYLINKSFYSRQSPQVRSAIDAHCTPEWARRVGASWAKVERAGREQYVGDATHTVVPLRPEDISAWQRESAPLRAKWQKSLPASAGDGLQLSERLQQVLRKYGAAY